MVNTLKNSQNTILTFLWTFVLLHILYMILTEFQVIYYWRSALEIKYMYMMRSSLIRYIYQRVLRSIYAPLIAQVAITFLRVSLHSFNIFTLGVSIGFRVPNDFVLKIIVFYFFFYLLLYRHTVYPYNPLEFPTTRSFGLFN